LVCHNVGFFAFDYRLLKKNGYGWRELEIIYNLAFLSTFGSALLAALVGILSGQLKTLIEYLVKLVVK